MKTNRSDFTIKRPLDTTDIASIGAPAQRALYNLGIRNLKDVTRYSKEELLSQHGCGPKAIRMLQEMLKEKGLDFAQL